MDNLKTLQVIRNHVILQSIFSNLADKELLPLRLVSSEWRQAIDKQLSKTVQADFSFSTKSIETELEYFKKLKISNVRFHFFTLQTRKEEKELVGRILENGGQIRKLILRDFTLMSMEDFIFFENILSSLPNLKSLVLIFPGICVSKFQDFNWQTKTFPSLREFMIDNPELIGEKLVPKLIEMFPNLSTNFQNVEMDVELLKLIGRGKFLGIFEKFEINTQGFTKQFFEILISEINKLPKGKLEIKRLVVWDTDDLGKEGLQCLTEILSKLDNSLEILELYSNPYIMLGMEKREMVIPPLKKLRKLSLGIPCYVSHDSFDPPKFSWNLGKTVAKDFPNLEYFKVETTLKQKFSYFDKPRAWQMWEPFLPINSGRQGEGAVLERFKHLKFVDLAIPNSWIGGARQLEWGREIVDIFISIYGNAGVGSMKKFIDWVKVEK